MKEIKLKRIIYKSFPGSGNYSARVPRNEMVKLNNINIAKYDFNAFIKMINKKYFEKDINIFIDLNYRICKYSWGVAYYSKKKVILYRHSIWIFLHEIAHIYDYHINSMESQYRRRPHGRMFGEILNRIYKLWKDYGHLYKLENVAYTYDNKIEKKRKITSRRIKGYIILLNNFYIKDWKTLELTPNKEEAHLWKRWKTAKKYGNLVNEKYKEDSVIIFL